MKRPLLHVVRDFLICVILFLGAIFLAIYLVTFSMNKLDNKPPQYSYRAQQAIKQNHTAHWYNLRYVKIIVFNTEDSTLMDDVRVNLVSDYGSGWPQRLWYISTINGIAKFKVKAGISYNVELSKKGYPIYMSPKFRFGPLQFRKTLKLNYPMQHKQKPEIVPVDTPVYEHQAPAPDPEPYFEAGGVCTAIYDSVRVRVAPSLESRTVAVLRQGEEVTYLNEESGTMSMVILRNEQFVNKWMRIRTKKGVAGWVFKSALAFDSDSDCGC